jgi:hypothetical protein
MSKGPAISYAILFPSWRAWLPQAISGFVATLVGTFQMDTNRDPFVIR